MNFDCIEGLNDSNLIELYESVAESDSKFKLAGVYCGGSGKSARFYCYTPYHCCSPSGGSSYCTNTGGAYLSYCTGAAYCWCSYSSSP